LATQNWADFGFSRVSTLLPKIKLGQPDLNAQILIDSFLKLSQSGSKVIVTPELALTGYTCEDLFHSEHLLHQTELALKKITVASTAANSLWVVGAPLRLMDGRLLNAAFVIHHGKVLGVVPKMFLPNMGEFYERRWFVSGRTIHEKISHAQLGEFWVSPFQIFVSGAVRVGVEICQDLWAPLEPSTFLALKGANLILNLSASNEVVGKADYRRKLTQVQSQKLQCAYAYVSAGTYESSKDTVFSGHALISELGKTVGEIEPFHADAESLTVDIDFESILNSRTKDLTFLEAVETVPSPTPIITHSFTFAQDLKLEELQRTVDAYPFLSEIPDFDQVVQIQSHGLLRKLQSANAKSMVLGISGGLDSTLALYVAIRTRALSGNTIKIIGITMPGPGTSEKTLQLSRTLLEIAGVDLMIEVPIGASVTQHLKDIGQSENDRGIVYENAQARERTQILFDLANEHHGMVIGTGDLSELALGWCTFNADHMAHYAVNSGIPKTVVKGMVGYWASIATQPILRATLNEILALPISPELLPPSADGSIAQETEALIGSYDLHDFFLYQYLSHGFTQEKIRALAKVAFADDLDLAPEIDRALGIFFGRFFSQQFKRTTLPPGPKIHQVSLSPRSDFRLPDEIRQS
jgi:NAD+ synthase (glutamine-hydrolysing)